MQVLDAIAEKLREIRDALPLMLVEVLEENAALIEGVNISQLQAGIKADGSPQRDYAPSSVAMGKPAGPILVFDSGSYYRGIRSRVRGGNLEIEGTDPKSAMLEKKLGPLTGVTPDNLELIKQDIILPGLQQKVQQRLSQ